MHRTISAHLKKWGNHFLSTIPWHLWGPACASARALFRAGKSRRGDDWMGRRDNMGWGARKEKRGETGKAAAFGMSDLGVRYQYLLPVESTIRACPPRDYYPSMRSTSRVGLASSDCLFLRCVRPCNSFLLCAVFSTRYSSLDAFGS